MKESALAAHWTLDPRALYLNHGSFGACPRVVLERQSELRARLEAQPVQFFTRDLETLHDEALGALASFVGADPADMGFVPNATTGVNAVLRSLRFEPGDEIVTTDHTYGACRNALDWVAERAGARVVTARVPFPIAAAEEVMAAVLEAVTPRTRLALLDHVTSPTGLAFPVARLVAALAERGVDTLIDGAHAPGMLPIDLRAIGAAYYAGNCHKWLCAPKGAGFLCVRRDRQAGLVPTTISHGLTLPRTDRSRFQLLFGWTGTGDPSAALCVPEAIRVVGAMVPGGWSEVMARNHSLALAARDHLCGALEIPPPAPDRMLGSLVTLPLPDGPDLALQEALWTQEAIEVPTFAWPAAPRRLLRISAQLYNTIAQFEVLATALRARLQRF
jgi:isopenicillin-N epimerase